MGHAYKILGKTVQPHILALATIATTVGAATFAMGGSKAENETKKSDSPVAPAASSGEELDVEKLLDDFLKEEKKN